MKAFIMACAAAIVIAVVGGVALNSVPDRRGRKPSPARPASAWAHKPGPPINLSAA